MKESYLYKPLKDLKVRCFLCNHKCLIQDRGIGECSVRKKISGKLYSLVYGKLIAENVDAIENKQRYNILTGSATY